ncbi:MAG: SIR2 family NAD-dependent protein deacylase [Dermatophilaceae bacterium]
MPAPKTDPTSAATDDIARSIAQGDCILFVGAGFSRAVTNGALKSASELAQSLVERLHDELDDPDAVQRVVDAVRTFDADKNPHYQLRLAAQYFVTELASAAGKETEDRSIRKTRYQSARRRLLDVLDAEVGRQVDHATVELVQTLMQMPWAGIYTTNYDTLLEAALSVAGVEYQVTTRPTDLASYRRDRLEVVKIHGSITELHLDEELPLVITADDYAEFSTTRGLLLDELRVNLAQKDFLFLGYGLQDDNLDLVIREVARAIEQSPRRLWVQHREPADQPLWNSLRQRGFELHQHEDLLQFVDHLSRSLAEFRTSHDEGYLRFAIRDRDQRDETVDLVEFHNTGVKVARQLWIDARSQIAPDIRHIDGDPVTALYHLLCAKSPEDRSFLVGDRTRVSRSVSAWLSKTDVEQILGTMQGYHRALECLADAAANFVGDDFRTMRVWLHAAAARHPDPLSRYVELQLLQQLQLQSEEKLAQAVANYCFETASQWKKEPDSDSNRTLRALVPRLASMLRDDPRVLVLLRFDEHSAADSLLVWELSKFSRQDATSNSDEGATRRLADGVGLPLSMVLSSDALEAAASLRIHPIIRRASLRAWFDEALLLGDHAELNRLVDFEEQFLPIRDSEDDEPFFSSFVLLEQIAEGLDRGLPDLLRRSQQVMLRMLNIADDAMKSSDPLRAARGWHLTVASTRVLLLALPKLAEDKRWLAEGGEAAMTCVLQRSFARAQTDPWLAENLLNVLAHRRSRPELHPALVEVDVEITSFLASCQSGDRWEAMSPLLRHYARRANFNARGGS